MNILEMKDIKKSFDGLEVLKGISLSVAKGEVLSVIGPSGSGKSTLLRCATLLDRIDSGSICYNGESMVENGKDGAVLYAPPVDLKRIRSYFGLVFQNFHLFPHFSVLRNITEAPIHVARQDPETAKANAMRLLAQMGLTDKAGAYPCMLSGGQQQRVSIARALALDPDILFFDEPTSALDPELTGDILKIIRDLASTNMTMVIVTHEMNFARDVSDRIIFMDDGVIVEQGDASTLINNPQHDRTKQFLSRYES